MPILHENKAVLGVIQLLNKKKGGRFTKLSAPEQQEAEKRVLDAVQSVLSKNAPLKALYDQLKAVAANVN